MEDWRRVEDHRSTEAVEWWSFSVAEILRTEARRKVRERRVREAPSEFVNACVVWTIGRGRVLGFTAVVPLF